MDDGCDLCENDATREWHSADPRLHSLHLCERCACEADADEVEKGLRHAND